MLVPLATVQRTPSDASETLLNRELSQIDLMRRVLELAADAEEPLLERVKFCGIVSSILDEFFMVRVAGLHDQVVSGLSVRSTDGRSPQETLAEIRTATLALTAEQTRIWRDELCPALAREGVRVGTVEDAAEAEHTARGALFPARSSRC